MDVFEKLKIFCFVISLICGLWGFICGYKLGYKKGRKDICNETGILTGKDAEKFLKDTGLDNIK